MLNVRTQPKTKAEKQACQYIIKEAIKDNISSRRQLLEFQKKACEKYKINFVTHPMLLASYRQLVKDSKIKPNKQLFELLRKRRIRTSSGIASVAVLTKPYPCPGKCIYCPTQKGTPKSYLNNEPAVMRAILADYDPVKQINIRLRGMELAGNPADKIELIVMGGTWSYLPRVYQLKFVIGCFAACNLYQNQRLKIKNQKHKPNILKDLYLNKKSIQELKKILQKEQTKNEKAKYRIIGLTLETRPDYITEEELKWFRELGCTRVEIGVQSIYDRILDKNKRGHLVSATIQATKLLKDAGFKVCYHLMPNLYGSNFKKDIQMFKILFSNQSFQPDMIKIYPCVVTKYAKLAKLYKLDKYKPYTDKELTKLLIEIKKDLPEYVRVQRLIRDIPAQNILGGSKISNLRQIIQNSNKRQVTSDKENKPLCQCIRCREIRENKKLSVKLKRIDYQASNGKEIFLQYVDKNNRIYALLRLRIPSQVYKCHSGLVNNKDIIVDPESEILKQVQNDKYKHWLPVLQDCAMIREVHTYGPMLEIGTRTRKDPQHTGLGKKLIQQAEQLTKDEFKLPKIAVISGIGVRDYYRKLGYHLNQTYMIKTLK